MVILFLYGSLAEQVYATVSKADGEIRAGSTPARATKWKIGVMGARRALNPQALDRNQNLLPAWVCIVPVCSTHLAPLQKAPDEGVTPRNAIASRGVPHAGE